MRNFATFASMAIAAGLLVGASLGAPAVAQNSLALPLPTPAPMPAQTDTAPQGQTPAAPSDATHARSAHHAAKIELPTTQTEAGTGPLQGAGPPQGNSQQQMAATVPGGGPLLLSPLQGAGPVSAREMLLGSATSLAAPSR